MKKVFFYLLFISLVTTAGILTANRHFNKSKSKKAPTAFPIPEEGEENEKLREKYNELRHRAAPGTDWKLVEARNRANASMEIKRRGAAWARPLAPRSFANGLVNGTWEEKGAKNITGSIRAVDYTSSENKLYVVSNGGSLWSSILGTGSWTLLNQSLKLDARIMKAFNKTGGGRRILVSENNNIIFSDDEGATFQPSAGINFPVAWGGNYIAAVIKMNDAGNSIYCLTRPWGDNPWGPRFWLYRSTDEGATFSRIYQFNTGDDETVSMCQPYNSSSLYVAEAGGAANTITLYTVTGTSVSPVNSFTTGQAINKCVIKGTFTSGATTFYALANDNSMYKISNSGGNWQLQFQSNLPEDAWGKLNVSPSDATKVFFGGVNAFRSSNSAQNWTKVNEWWEYYDNEATKLHADIMEIEFFNRSDNTEFAIINCHGGVFSSNNLMTTVKNESLSSLIAVEYYDIITDTLHPDIIIGGTQDQGLQHTLTGNAAGAQNFKQVISGDYGHLCLTKNNNIVWAEYPGSEMYIFSSLNTADPQYLVNWRMGGTQMSNYGWMIPAKATTSLAANEIWIGGGNINGGGGSYLAKATLSNSEPYTVSATQFNYDFRANSTSGASGVSAIEQSPVNSNKLFVATEDGSFFYSNDLGTSWNRTTSFSGPGTWYLYGSCILASKLDQNTVWYAGSGYSNPAVYKSVNGGITFTDISNGLPPTLVNEIVASPDEAYLFAATEAGPYVYVVADNMWYSLYDNVSPVQFYTGVEYLTASNTVRFSTMGRGIWDFRLAVSYTFTGNGNWNDASHWSGNVVPPANLPSRTAIVIDPVAGGECFVNVPVTIPANCSLTVNPGKKLRVNGNLIIVR